MVLELLVAAWPAMLSTSSVLRRLARVMDTEPDTITVQAALRYLEEKGKVRRVQDELSPTVYWTATADGVDTVQRRGM